VHGNVGGGWRAMVVLPKVFLSGALLLPPAVAVAGDGHEDYYDNDTSDRYSRDDAG
jgi:hypothetical protein